MQVDFFREILVPVIGGLGIFMLGLEFMSNGIQDMAVNRMRELLARIAGTPIKGVIDRSDDAFNVILNDSTGASAYPITATVFVFMHKSAPRARTRATLNFLQWSLDKGAQSAAQLGYVPLPAALVTQVKEHWKRTVSTGSSQ
jgi:hypothetical protein